MRPSDSRSVTVLPGTSQESSHSKGAMLPPLTSQYPQWSRGGKLGISLFPRPVSSENENGLPFQRSSLTEKVNKKSPDLAGVGRSEGLVVTPVDPLLRITQLEQNIRFLQDQHRLMLTSLHQEVEQLRHRNRDLQFQLVFTKSGFIQSSPSPSSPEDDTKPKQVVLSPKQLNMTSLQVEILEKEIAELKAALQEAKTKNVYLTGIVEEQKRKLERLECRKQELEALGSKVTPAVKLDAQNQAGAYMTDGVIVSQDVLDEQTLAVKLEEAEKIIRRLRRENEENRRELMTVRANVSKGLGGSGGGRQLGGNNGHRGGGGGGVGGSNHRSHSQQQSQSQRFPPLHTQSYWHHGQQSQHRGGIEYVSHRHCTNGGNNGGRLEKDTQLVGRPAPSLPNLRNSGTSSGYGFANSNNGNSGNSHRRGGHFNGNGNHYYRGSKDEVGDSGRKYRGGGGSRGSRERKQ